MKNLKLRIKIAYAVLRGLPVAYNMHIRGSIDVQQRKTYVVNCRVRS